LLTSPQVRRRRGYKPPDQLTMGTKMKKASKAISAGSLKHAGVLP
jgi:hypothetical protein